MAKTLTSASSAWTMIAQAGPIPFPIKLEGFSTDNSFSVANQNPVQAEMGVDGKASFGYVPQLTVITFVFQATSPTLDKLDAILAYQKAQNEVVTWNGTGLIPGTGEKYALINGAMTEISPAVGGTKTLGPRTFVWTFEKFDKAPI